LGQWPKFRKKFKAPIHLPSVAFPTFNGRAAGRPSDDGRSADMALRYGNAPLWAVGHLRGHRGDVVAHRMSDQVHPRSGPADSCDLGKVEMLLDISAVCYGNRRMYPSRCHS